MSVSTFQTSTCCNEINYRPFVVPATEIDHRVYCVSLFKNRSDFLLHFLTLFYVKILYPLIHLRFLHSFKITDAKSVILYIFFFSFNDRCVFGIELQLQVNSSVKNAVNPFELSCS